ncbi:MAG: hypothetical protein ACLPWS_07545 [Rhodomicrobium sp.]
MNRLCKKALRTAGVVSALALIAVTQSAWDVECNQCDRTEFVTRGVGDAIDVNKAAQTIDPWPPYVRNRHLSMNGKRADLAIQRYETNRELRPRPLNPTKAAEQPIPDNALQAPAPQQ